MLNVSDGTSENAADKSQSVSFMNITQPAELEPGAPRSGVNPAVNTSCRKKSTGIGCRTDKQSEASNAHLVSAAARHLRSSQGDVLFHDS
jgi:hypothetical protein